MSTFTRREALVRSALGLGVLGVSGTLTQLARGDVASALRSPLAPRATHFQPRAKRVIVLFMTGGASHVDTFDPKPYLQANHGKSTGGSRSLMASPYEASAQSRCGTMVTDLFPYVRRQMDEICLIRSMYGDANDHFQATLGMHTGSVAMAVPSMGAWVSYALGTQNPNLPSHVVFAGRTPYAGSQVWDSNFLPAYHQGVRIVPGSEPIPYLKPPTDSPQLQALENALLDQRNRTHLMARGQDDQLAGRLQSFAAARSLQKTAPEVFSLKDESDATLESYGLRRSDTTSFAWQCLMARRLSERGVRFIELIDTGANNNWDAHGDIRTHEPLAKAVDQPIAALIQDLKQRGLLDETLVVWCTEFGRTPSSQGKGREHHCRAFSCWLAGGGVKPGHVHGSTDETGSAVATDPVHIHDFHATILHLLGLNHEQLTFRHAGRDFRLTDVAGEVVKGILA